MRYKGLDLNLLSALDTLIEEGSVTRAAERLNLSQPAMSAALARLREYFDDPLLVAKGRRMIPTARGMELRKELSPVLAQLDEVIARSSGFDPAQSNRTFAISASDYLLAVAFPALVTKLQQRAPGVMLDIIAPSQQAQTALDRGEIDLLLTPEEHCVAGHPAELLYEEQHVVAGWQGNPAFASQITLERFLDAGHVAVRVGQTSRASFAESQLASHLGHRRIEITAPSFTSVPDLLIGSNRIAVMHRRLAQVVERRLPIAWQELPFPFPPMRQMAQRNSARKDDAGLDWLVGELRDSIDAVGGGAAG